MNSRSYQKYSKAPMSKKNQSIWEDTFRRSANYIRGLRHPDGTSVLKGPRRAAFIGWLVNIDSLTRMFHDLVSIGQVTYIRTYKLIQGKCLIFSIILVFYSKLKGKITLTPRCCSRGSPGG